MATSDLATLVEPLKRELAVPGEFDSIFPNTTDDDLAGALDDGFSQAQLDGFFGAITLDTTTHTVDPALSGSGGALVIIYASERIIRAQLRNLQNRQKYEAGGAVYEIETSSNILTQELRTIRDRKKELLALILRQSRSGQAVYVMDGYLIRAGGYFTNDSFFGYELDGFGALAGL